MKKEKKWVEEGSWTLVDGYFIGEVNHFTPWNVDVPRQPPTSEIFGRVVDQTGKPLENALVRLNGETTRFAQQIYTDENGKFSLTTLENTEFLIEASWSFYYPTLITKTSSGEDNSQVNAADIIIDVSDENEAEPLITESLVKMMPGETVVINGNYFGNQYRINYKVLIDGVQVDVITNWSNNEIQFTVPNWINPNGIVQILRGNSESNEVEYKIPNDSWTVFGKELGSNFLSQVLTFTENGNGEIILGTELNGMFSIRDGVFLHLLEPNSISDMFIDIFVDSIGNYWISSLERLYTYSEGNVKNWYSEIPLHPVRFGSITEDGSCIIWASSNKGLIKIENNEVTVFDSENSGLKPGNVSKVYYSKATNSIWMIIENSWLIEYDGTNFKQWYSFVPNISGVSIRNIIEDNEGVLWFATANHGLTKFENNQFTNWNTSNSDLPSNDIKDISIASDGSLWLATWGEGLVRFDKDQNFETWNTENSDILSNKVITLLEASDGSVWLSLSEIGLAKLDFIETDG